MPRTHSSHVTEGTYDAVGVPLWAPMGLVLLWVVADLASFPARRWYYQSEPATARMLGERGEVVSALTPRGQVRVHGELWRAHAVGAATVAQGMAVRVIQVSGLELRVEPVAGRDPDRPGLREFR